MIMSTSTSLLIKYVIKHVRKEISTSMRLSWHILGLKELAATPRDIVDENVPY